MTDPFFATKLRVKNQRKNMDSVYTILDIERAINFWRTKEVVGEAMLGDFARTLADVYGRMIYEKEASVAATSLTAKQLKALATAHPE